MVMKNKHQKSSKTSELLLDNPLSSSDHGPDSPISADFSTPTTAIIASSNKSRRGIQKRVVSIPIQDGDGSRSKAEAYPPSDSWAWRKYGQKPIKGSPYPRGYYRCSASKGCPARKQVERSRVDPTMLIITYAYEHNHPLPTTKQQHHHHHNNHQSSEAAALATENSASPSSPSCIADCGEESSPSSPSHVSLFGIGDPPELEFVRDSSTLGNLGVEFNWISDLTFGTPALVQPKSEVIEVSTLSMKEEDKLLFGDLGELPECSLVFRHRHGNIERCTNSTPICGRLIL